MIAVPVIDLTAARHGGASERRQVAGAIDRACREIGFFAVTGHGVPDQLVERLRAVAHAFFERPMADKLAYRHLVAGTNRGYHPVGGEALSKANEKGAASKAAPSPLSGSAAKS